MQTHNARLAEMTLALALALTATAAPAQTPDASPAGAKPAEAKPAESKPAESKPAEAKPADAKPAEAKPADAKPADAKPAEVKPPEAKPAQTKPAEAKPAGTKPAEAKSAEAKPAEAKPAEAKPADAKASGDPAAAQDPNGAPVDAAVAPPPPPPPLQVLDGKLHVAIPAGFAETEFPSDPATPEVSGKIYLNRATMQAIIVIDVPVEQAVGDDDAFTLGAMAAGFQSQQQAAVPTFKKTGDGAFKVGSIGVFQLDATSRLSGRPAELTALFAASGKKVVTFSVYTLAQEKARHPGLVEELKKGMSVTP
ncbi:MAG: hypothetical protein K0S02_1044 [Achromobacter mucicolens]|jgi:hypothetical protein|uniref:hypothetical protein n=1 Tax=Achromobacter mucicolens TaxID=1389922 RepID=UPI00242F1C9D|nr:hypothetical protein [Achromobacter mucicolens]MDF2860772.1 hypothetical protein [Achromobacter mucicolens]